MNLLKLSFIAILFSPLTYADDTEIYGTSGVIATNYNEPNVLFIVDTSGSMRGSVTYDVSTAFNPNTNYTNDTKVLENPNYITSWGWKYSKFQSSCSEVLATMNSVGFATSNALQLRDGSYQSLKLSTQEPIECYPYQGDIGFEYTFYSADYGSWLRDYNSASITSTRMNVIRDVITNLADNLEGVKLGLMEFDGSSGGKVDVDIATISDSKASIKETVKDYSPGGGTPLTEALHDAALYFRGDSNNTSPITAQCQKNHVILFTDGEPSSDTGSNSTITGTYIKNLDLDGIEPALSKSCSGDGGCLEELAYWMQNTDQSGIDGDQVITTHTIGGFGLTSAAELLGNTATHGGGKYYEADDAPGIAAVVAKIFENILETDATFTAPAVSVNAFNTSEHRDELFYALFSPADNIKWGGNLKKYKLTTGGEVVSKDGTTAAIDANTGYFDANAQGFWNLDNDNPDGDDVTLGGMANLLDYTARNIYTETTSTTPTLTALNSSTGASISSFDVADSTELTNMVDWSYGKNVNNSDGGNRYSIGDPLHSEPVIVTYGGTDANPDSTIFFGTNEGFIHAIDTRTDTSPEIGGGKEVFSFIPQALHGIQKDYYENDIAASAKPYGMDGPISTWIKDENKNNVILKSTGTEETAEEDEHAYLYAGMRRGGRNYYGLDVTYRSKISETKKPKFLFKIEGGTNTAKGDFTKLGQTWSRMQIAKVTLDGTVTPVLFFTGGYDTNQDSNTSTNADSMGNAVYMVNATSGDLLWSASNSGASLNIDDMDYSMPASPSLVDHNGDGFVDYFFTADMGGQVFRFDINHDNSGKDDFAQGGIIASIAGSGLAGKRRFYNKPNISLIKDSQYGDYLTIALGSGHRAHPKNTTEVENRFYVIKDFSPYGPPSVEEKPPGSSEPDAYIYVEKNETISSEVDPSKLYDATTIMNGGTIDSDSQNMLNGGGGFYVTLSSGGEKVLSESITFSGAIIFTTFKPKTAASTANSCGANTGEARMYAINQRNASPILNLDDDTDLEASTLLSHSGIAPRPVVIYREGGGKTIAVGTEAINDSRFEPTDPDDCTEGESCEVESKCESNNCNVTPLYWRQNDVH